MAFEYKGSYYPTLAIQRAAILRDEYKNKPQALKTFQEVARAATPNTGQRNQNRQAQVDLKTWDLVKGFEQAMRDAAPAPAPAPAPSGPSPQQQQAVAQLTKESEAYRAEAEKTIAAGKARVAELENVELQRQKAAELQNRLAIQAQTSQARGAAQASLKIAPASQTAQTAGTQAFKRRRDQMRLAPIQSTAGINAPANSVLNV